MRYACGAVHCAKKDKVTWLANQTAWLPVVNVTGNVSAGLLPGKAKQSFHNDRMHSQSKQKVLDHLV